MQPTRQTILTNDTIAYDSVGNPLTIADGRLAAEWPSGAKPVLTRSYGYDDAYRVTSVVSTFAANVDPYTPPLASSMPDTSPLPMSLASDRVRSQTFKYDGLGNTLATTDDSGIFFDRSLGTITNGAGSANGAASGGPNQLLSASLPATTGVAGGNLAASYDVAGNLVELTVQRSGACTSGSSCYQEFDYTWDEVGQLSSATRYDTPPPPACTGRICPQIIISRTPAAAVQYAYDASGSRVLRTGQDDGGAPTYSVEIFPSLRLNHTTWDAGTSTYERTADTEAVYLMVGGASFGRVVSDATLPNITGPQHVFLQLTDQLNSTTTVIDKDTSELVERTTYLSYGGLDTDYRPDRWNDFREDYKFTGKEEDVELGLTYFGGRYYSAQMGRWISPDPRAVHQAAADLNPYAYVGGQVSRLADPDGFDPDDGSCDGCFTNGHIDAIFPGTSTTSALPSFLDSWSSGYSSAEAGFDSAALWGETSAMGPVAVWAGDWTMQQYGAEGSPESIEWVTAGVAQPYSGWDPRSVLNDYEDDRLTREIQESIDNEHIEFNLGMIPSLQELTGLTIPEGAWGRPILPTTNPAQPAPIEVNVSKARYPESAQHIEDAQNAGQPAEMTIDRNGAAARRRASLRGTDSVPGMDRDEYPPAMFEEGGEGTSVRPIAPGDNRGAGACMGAQCRGAPNGSRVIIRVTP